MFLEHQALAFEIEPSLLGLVRTNDLATLISRLLPIFISLAGLALFAYLLLGGLKYLSSGGDEKAVQDARKIMTNALIGMLIIFVAFWVIRILETVLGLKITGL